MKKTLLALALSAAGSVHAAAVIQSAPLIVELTEINQVFNIGLFDESLGTLTAVDITLRGEVVSSATLLNEAAGPERFGFQSTLNLFLDGVGISEMLGLNLFNLLPTLLPSGVLTDLGTVNPTASVTFTASDLSAFIGSGMASFTCQSLATNTQIGGGGNILVTQSTEAGCGLDVVYTYDANTPPPSDVPEPGSMVLLGLGLLGLAATRRRK